MINKKKSSITEKSSQNGDEGAFTMSPSRLNGLTDGVFAITMTLLVIELFPEEIWDNPHGGTILYTYAVGFFSLGVYWTLHHYLFHYIERTTGLLIWLNIVFLAASSLTPFWTKVIVDTETFTNGFLYYILFMIFVMFTLLIMWHYATDNHRCVKYNFSRKLIRPFSTTLIFGMALLKIALVAGFLYPPLGNLLFLPGVFFIIVTVYGPHKIFN